jgi:deglycase
VTAELEGKTVAFLVANEGVEEIELTEPWEAIERAGGQLRLVAPSSDPVQAFNHLEKAGTFQADLTVDRADVSDFDALVLPGGVANPDRLRMDQDSVAFVAAFFRTGKPVAAICHAPWLLIEAEVVRSRQLTSYPSLQTDLRNAGATWLDEEVVICTGGRNTLITSRRPGDLKAFIEALLEHF